MARYQKPPDPRKNDTDLTRRRTRYLRGDSRNPIPWLWLGLGIVVTFVAVWLSLSLASWFLTPDPLSVGGPPATVIVLTAPPTQAPTTTSLVPTPTSIPTFTPSPTPDRAVAPDEIMVDFYVRVVNTDGIGVSIRGGPSVDNPLLQTAPEGSVMLVIDGPVENGNFEWWQVQLPDGAEGWSAGDFLEPAPAP